MHLHAEMDIDMRCQGLSCLKGLAAAWPLAKVSADTQVLQHVVAHNVITTCAAVVGGAVLVDARFAAEFLLGVTGLDGVVFVHGVVCASHVVACRG